MRTVAAITSFAVLFHVDEIRPRLAHKVRSNAICERGALTVSAERW